MKNHTSAYLSLLFVAFCFKSLYSMNFSDKEFLKEYEKMEKLKQNLETNWAETPQNIINEIIAGERDCNTRDKEGITLLFYGIKTRKLATKQILQLLNIKNNDFSVIDSEQNSLLHIFYKNFYEFEDEYDEILNLLQKKMSKLNADNMWQQKPKDMKQFQLYEWKNVPFPVQMTIATHPKLYSLVDEQKQQTLLMYFIENARTENYNKEIIKNWIEKSSLKNLLQKDKDGNGLLHCVYKNFYVLNKKHPDLISLLKKKGLNFKEKNDDNKLPIQMLPKIEITQWGAMDEYATYYMDQSKELYRTLDGRNPTTDIANGETIISYRVRNVIDDSYNKNTTEKCIKKIKTIINVPDYNGNTPLHHAYMNYYKVCLNHPKLIEFLIENGADTTISNNDGKTPEEVKQSSRNVVYQWSKKELVKYDNVIEYNNVQDNNGETPLMFLIKNNTYRDSYNKRIFTFSTDTLEDLIPVTDLQYIDTNGKTALDYLLQSSSSYNVWGPCYFVVEKNDSDQYQYKLFITLLSAALKSGYDFQKNPQTTLELLGNNFYWMPVIKKLIGSGIQCGSTPNFFEEEPIETLRNKIIEYDRHSNNSSSQEELETFLSKKENTPLWPLLFCRAAACNQKSILKLFHKKMPNYFTPLKAFEYAAQHNRHEAVNFILKGFSLPTLRLLYETIQQNESLLWFISPKTNHEKLYAIYKKAKNEGCNKFCNKVKKSINLLMSLSGCITKSGISIPDEVIQVINNYV